MSTASYRTPSPYPPFPANGRRDLLVKKKTEISRPHTWNSPLAWWDGQMVPFDQAKRYFSSPKLYYGEAGIRGYGTARGPAVFRLQEHISQFLTWAHTLGIGEPRFTPKQLAQVVFSLIEGNGLSDCYVRPLLFWNSLPDDDHTPVISMVAWPWVSSLAPTAETNGVPMVILTQSQMSHTPFARQTKIDGPPLLAQRTGVAEAVVLDAEGYVADCTGENLFLVQDNRIVMPQTNNRAIDISRDTVMTLAQDTGYWAVEKRLTQEDLLAADELFICGPATELVAVVALDGQPVGDGRMGRVTRQMQQMMNDTVRGRNRRSWQWLDYVSPAPFI